MRIRPLTDESDRQQQQCAVAGVQFDFEFERAGVIAAQLGVSVAEVVDMLDHHFQRDVAWGADPFDIVAEIEEQQGYALRSS